MWDWEVAPLRQRAACSPSNTHLFGAQHKLTITWSFLPPFRYTAQRTTIRLDKAVIVLAPSNLS